MSIQSFDPNYQPKGAKEWIEYRLPIFSFINNAVGSNYPTPRNLNYWWNFGAIAGICLMLQILTGIFLAMNYAAHTDIAFDSVERIMRDVNYGWLLRYMHAVGASMFFVVVYIHICRGLYYGSYKAPREILWWLGLVIFLLMMATAFMGYVLPWGQMSFWGAKVITSLFSAIPLIGDSIVHWLWGGFSVDNPTLNRFFAIHFVLPFVIVGVVILHIWALHRFGSNNPTGIEVKGSQDTIPFHPYYTVKDMFGFGVFFMVLSAFVFFAPNSLGHPDNYIPANPMITPAHIVPEWYFLPFYAILRAVTMDLSVGLILLGASGALAVAGLFSFIKKKLSILPVVLMFLGAALLAFVASHTMLMVIIDAKLGGVIAMFGSILIMFALPWIDRSKVRSAHYRPIYKIMFWAFLLNALLLGYAGSQSVDWGTIIAFFTESEVKAMESQGVHIAAWIPVILSDGMKALADGLPDLKVSAIATFYYFFHFALLWWISPREKTLPLPTSIMDSVLKKSHAGAH
jgi:quinol-cytochrome oxidoreductase complex cytochrome b subunit